MDSGPGQGECDVQGPLILKKLVLIWELQRPADSFHYLSKGLSLQHRQSLRCLEICVTDLDYDIAALDNYAWGPKKANDSIAKNRAFGGLKIINARKKGLR